MCQRTIAYNDDPGAPKANRIVPSVNVIVVNHAGEMLMIRRTDNDNYANLCGAIDLCESVVQAAICEAREEVLSKGSTAATPGCG